ncbi:MAG TPA: TetR/AcrR family transcriptional regulator [Gaiellaceae bacterium]|nr:TetR/AcrR family transcriptional regulator [Gaiellaceae bacterium]
MAVTSRPRRPRADGERSRRRILLAAAELASVEGLNGLSIGRLAEHVGMSKSGLYAHFRSKEELLLATVDTASAILAEEVVVPGCEAPEGVDRLIALCDAFLSHVERRVFPGGCFFASAAAELSTQPGPARERIAASYHDWIGLLESQAVRAQELGQIPAGVDAKQLVFELNGMLVAANVFFLLFDDPGELERARSGVRAHLPNLG